LGHICNAKGGSKIVQALVLKHGQAEFAFIVLEQIESNKEIILAREQFYLDTLNPSYNILKTAGSVLVRLNKCTRSAS
jgi:hypothetical protein